MATAMENMLRFGGGLAGGNNLATRTADAMNPTVQERNRVLDERKQQRNALINSGILGTISQQNPNFDAQGFIEGGGDVSMLGNLAKLANPEPTELQNNLQTLGMLGKMTPEEQKQYQALFGKGGTTVNVGGNESPMANKFNEEMGKGLAQESADLRAAATDYSSQVRSSEQALNILESNPNLDISPTARIGADVKSLFSPFLDEKELQNVADFQTLDSQLIRNRFDVTKVLKGAITEQEQTAAQTVAGTPTGTREGLTQTLRNNIAYGTLEADYNQRKAEYIQNMVSQGKTYSPKKFDVYYKELGEQGLRPTLDSLLPKEASKKTSKAGNVVKWGEL